MNRDKWDGWVSFCWVVLILVVVLTVIFMMGNGSLLVEGAYGSFEKVTNWPVILGGFFSIAFTVISWVVIAMVRDTYKLVSGSSSIASGSGSGVLVKEIEEGSPLSDFIGAGYYILSVNGHVAGGPLSISLGLKSRDKNSPSHKIVVKSPSGDVREVLLEGSIEDLKLEL